MRPLTRPTVQLPKHLNERLNAYALAGAAIGIAALPTAAPAEIVYTPTHVFIGPGANSYDLDLNADGINDFQFQFLSSHSGQSIAYLALHMVSQPPPKSVVVGSYGAAALKKGDVINASDDFRFCRSYCSSGFLMAFAEPSRDFGSWVNVKNHYLGLRLHVKGQAHYGWARLSVQVSGVSVSAILTGYAYETTPNKSIRAGQTSGPTVPDNAEARTPNQMRPSPGSLGWLARGAQR
jgi:hypothetical protein